VASGWAPPGGGPPQAGWVWASISLPPARRAGKSATRARSGHTQAGLALNEGSRSSPGAADAGRRGRSGEEALVADGLAATTTGISVWPAQPVLGLVQRMEFLARLAREARPELAALALSPGGISVRGCGVRNPSAFRGRLRRCSTRGLGLGRLWSRLRHGHAGGRVVGAVEVERLRTLRGHPDQRRHGPAPRHVKWVAGRGGGRR
jgi:hypothetical protein